MKIILISIILMFSTINIISQDSLLEYYPMNIGDERHYFRYKYDVIEEDTLEIYDIRCERIIGDTVLNNGEKYFVFQRDSNFPEFLEFRRIDSLSFKVYEYFEDSSVNKELDIFDLSKGNDSNWVDLWGNMHEVKHDTSITNNYGINLYIIQDVIPTWSIYKRKLAKGIGLIHFEKGDLGKHQIEKLVFAKVNRQTINLVTSQQDENNTIPNNYELKQNYPNPFNPTTTIEFTIANESDVNINLYNISGQLVKNLLNARKTSGEHKIELDATNLSTGIYFYQLRIKNLVLTKKLMLIK